MLIAPSNLFYKNMMGLKKMITSLNNFIKIIRANFLLATIMPIIFSITWSIQLPNVSLRLDLLIALIIGLISCHIATNTFNDYFDWQSGTDQINTNYIPTISGGSRAIESNLITTKQLLVLATIFLFIAAICAIYLSLIRGPIIMLLSIIGGGAAYFYTAPPIRLVARRGLGEIFLFLCFGPLLIFGIIYVLTAQITLTNFLIGIPIGMLITSVLLINEVPDQKSDAITNKNNFAVTFGFNGVFWAVIILSSSAYIITLSGILYNLFPKSFLLTLLTTPIAIYQIVLIYTLKSKLKNINYFYSTSTLTQNNQKVVTQNILKKACINNLVLYTCFSISFIIAALLS